MSVSRRRHPRTRRMPGITVLLLALVSVLCLPLAPSAHAGTSSSPPPGLRADYYPLPDTNNTNDTPGPEFPPSGEPSATIVDSNIDSDDLTASLAELTGTSTDAGIQWTGNLTAPSTGNYTFNYYGDNGFRLYVDGRLVIDNWLNNWNVNKPGQVDLTAGTHTFRADYYQATGGAFAKLSWQPPGASSLVPVPASAFTLPDGYTPTVERGELAKDGRTIRLTFGHPLGTWPSTATSHLSAAGFPITSAAVDPTDSKVLVITLDGTVYDTWGSVPVSYDGKGGATYADDSDVPKFYTHVDNSSTVPMTTPWTSKVDPKNPLPEYPRPQLTRNKWQSLNGTWSFEGRTGDDANIAEEPAADAKLPDKIVVPYPMESTLSGVRKHYDNAFYRRSFTVPTDWRQAGRRVILHFGAVNYQATIWVNGKQVATHTGGYLPFSADVTDALKSSGAQQLTVGVTNTGAASQPQGKQVMNPSGIFYTASSGIWQSVWMEPTPAQKVDQVVFTPTLPKAPSTDGASVTVQVNSSTSKDGKVDVRLYDGTAVVATGTGKANTPFSIALPKAHLWSPDDPFLYHAKVTLKGSTGTDQVGSYFGERTVEVGKVNGVPKILLNGKPTFVNATLDQGFWPDGAYTAPTDAALKWDITATKDLGFNAIRKHIKVEPARWYYAADTTGMLVMQDMPSMESGFSATPAQDTEFRSQLHQMVEELKGETSIISWEPYNEGWGMDRGNVSNAISEVKLAAEQVAKDDPSRLVDAESGFNCCGSVNSDTGAGNIVDWHTYTGPARPQPDVANNRPAIDGEHGGWGLSIPAHSWNVGFINYAGASDSAQLTQKFETTQGALAKEAACQLSGGVYTQITDVEGEINGLWTYDRKVPKLDVARARAANEKVIAAGSSAGDCG